MNKYNDKMKDSGKKPKRIIKKMIGNPSYSVECTCGADCISSDSGSYIIDSFHYAICEGCDQRWYFKETIRKDK